MLSDYWVGFWVGFGFNGILLCLIGMGIIIFFRYRRDIKFHNEMMELSNNSANTKGGNKDEK